MITSQSYISTVAIFIVYNAPKSEIYQELFNVYGERHSPNTLPTTVQGQTLCIITWQPPPTICQLEMHWNLCG